MAKYVDGSTLRSVSSTSENSQLHWSAQEADAWADHNLMSLNCDKTKDLVVCFVRKCPTIPAIKLGGSEVERASQVKLLGMMLANDLKWQGHIDYVCGKGSSRLYFLKMLRRAGMDPKDIIAIYVVLIHSILEYACHVWHSGLTAQQQSDQLELVQWSALRVAYPNHSYRASRKITGLDILRDRWDRLCCTFFANILEPAHILHLLLPVLRQHSYIFRDWTKYPTVAGNKSNCFRNTLLPYELENWQYTVYSLRLSFIYLF